MICHRRNMGASLVEVLVVIIVLLVGILAAVRLFPPGFVSVQRAESMTIASRLAQLEMERWKNNPENLPEGLLPIDADGASVLSDLYLGPRVTDDNALVVRRIIGETTRIPFGGWSTGPETGSRYILAFAPIAPGTLAVRGGNLNRRVLDSDNENVPRTLRSNQYAIDYDDMKIAFRTASEDRTYYLTCSFWRQSSTGGDAFYNTMTGIRINVPGGTTSWLDIPIPSGSADFLSIDPQSDSVSRGFTQLAAGSGWSGGDPYQFQLLDPLLGIISFNPLGFTQYEFGRKLEAKIDYDMLDPQIIREDVRLPQLAPYKISLTLKHIMESGVSMKANDTVYGGLHPLIITDDIIAVDMKTTARVDLSTAEIDFEQGSIEFPAEIELFDVGFVPSAGRNIRFFYKADGEWSVQLHKAYSAYERVYDPNAMSYRDYYVDDDNAVWFTACNANFTISVDYEYIGSDGQPHKVVGECHRTTDSLRPIGGVDATYIRLDHTPARLFAVSGVSARSRVVWIDGTRWRYVDFDTTVMKKQAE